MARGAELLWDAGTYAVVRWGIQRARGLGVSARPFAHHSPGALARAVRAAARRGLKPLVITDGHCVGCGRPAPLGAYVELARRAGGRVLVDDTQALGLAGARGGGSLRRAGLDGDHVLWIASLAKAFGAPLAAFAADRATVVRYRAESETRVHSSPPCAAALGAAARALAVNAACGDALRARLASRIRRLRCGLARHGLRAEGGAHPVQLLAPAGVEAARLVRALGTAGLRAVALARRCDGGPAAALVLTAAHADGDIDRAVELIAGAVERLRGADAPCGAEGGA